MSESESSAEPVEEPKPERPKKKKRVDSDDDAKDEKKSDSKKHQSKDEEKYNDNNPNNDFVLVSFRAIHVQLTMCKLCQDKAFQRKKGKNATIRDLGDDGCIITIELCAECRKNNKIISNIQRQSRQRNQSGQYYEGASSSKAYKK